MLRAQSCHRSRCRKIFSGAGSTFAFLTPDSFQWVAGDAALSPYATAGGWEPTHAEVFEPQIVPGTAKFIWLGSDKLWDTFTFLIRENEHGLFQVHAYRFDVDTSTFSVECDEQDLAQRWARHRRRPPARKRAHRP